jgi:hypothetical protein
MMLCNIQNHLVSGLCASSVIQNNYKTHRYGNWICFFFSGEGRETPTLLGLSEETNLNHCITYVSKY